MPSYKVLECGFFHGRLYDPAGKRPVLHTDEPFPTKNKVEQVPAWLERVKEETPQQKAARTRASKKAAEKAQADKELIEQTSFLGAGEAPSSVETL